MLAFLGGPEFDAMVPLLAGVLILGFRHGFDWDHIAAITDITSTAVAASVTVGAVAAGTSSSTLRARWRPPRRALAQQYGARASYGIGMIHGVGAETASQVLLIVALGGAAGRDLGVPMTLTFILGLVLANTVVVGVSASGFSGMGNRPRAGAGFGGVVGIASIAVGTVFILGLEAGLPDLTEMLGGSTVD